MKKNQINIRDPFVLYENGKYYMYGTRGRGFGISTGGFDVYVSDDLESFSDPIECFNSEKYGFNKSSNWAPEVHKYKGKFYMFATFEQKSGFRGTYSLVAESPLGPFETCSCGALTPYDWSSLDGTLYIDENEIPYLVFCHEHTQIKDGTVCYVKLNEDLSAPIGEITTLFKATDCKWVDPIDVDHFVTDGPFFHRVEDGELFMIWSSFIKGNYAQLVVKFKGGKLGSDFEHLDPMLDNDGGHGMIFNKDGKTYFTYHTPNTSGEEHPEFRAIRYNGGTLEIDG